MFQATTGTTKTANNGPKRGFQLQKIYIENISISKTSETLETDIFKYFTDFGHVIDVKVLLNGWFKR
jgi:hypothetical protein